MLPLHGIVSVLGFKMFLFLFEFTAVLLNGANILGNLVMKCLTELVIVGHLCKLGAHITGYMCLLYTRQFT